MAKPTKGLRAKTGAAKLNKTEQEEMNVQNEEVEEEEVEETEVEEQEQEQEQEVEKEEEAVKEEPKKEEAPTVTVDTQATAKAAEKKVRIRPNKDLSTYIGTEWYNLKAGKEVTVPENVKAILRRAGHLEAL